MAKNHLQKHIHVIDAENADISDSATFAGGKDFDVPPASVKIVAERDAVTEVQD